MRATSTLWSPMLAVCLLVWLAVCCRPTVARVDFNCLFGDIINAKGADGKPMAFCPTGMDPPMMKEGTFIWASKDGACYECVCERGMGLACCECPRRRRG